MIGIRLLRTKAAATGALSAKSAGRTWTTQRRFMSSDEHPVEATEETFAKEVLESSKPVVVDFYADWCKPCQMLAPVIDAAVRKDGRVRLAKVNVDTQQSLASDYKITSLPTVVGFHAGQPVAAFIGMRAPAAVAQFVKEVAEKAK
ncbi:hypothetical protein H4R20_005350 [Coemansia guatemalensis]|uniref:Thioredoxin domain-containing protein n=1 Tax=Coemansia guatemalensis TaxID=2761395 RepID=A0A9W8HUE8_9FUNG|nr:hypothetical protein H4R20_005350 [Coemansia guatemalensis]